MNIFDVARMFMPLPGYRSDHDTKKKNSTERSRNAKKPKLISLKKNKLTRKLAKLVSPTRKDVSLPADLPVESPVVDLKSSKHGIKHLNRQDGGKGKPSATPANLVTVPLQKPKAIEGVLRLDIDSSFMSNLEPDPSAADTAIFDFITNHYVDQINFARAQHPERTHLSAEIVLPKRALHIGTKAAFALQEYAIRNDIELSFVIVCNDAESAQRGKDEWRACWSTTKAEAVKKRDEGRLSLKKAESIKGQIKGLQMNPSHDPAALNELYIQLRAELHKSILSLREASDKYAVLALNTKDAQKAHAKSCMKESLKPLEEYATLVVAMANRRIYDQRFKHENPDQAAYRAAHYRKLADQAAEKSDAKALLLEVRLAVEIDTLFAEPAPAERKETEPPKVEVSDTKPPIASGFTNAEAAQNTQDKSRMDPTGNEPLTAEELNLLAASELNLFGIEEEDLWPEVLQKLDQDAQNKKMLADIAKKPLTDEEAKLLTTSGLDALFSLDLDEPQSAQS